MSKRKRRKRSSKVEKKVDRAFRKFIYMIMAAARYALEVGFVVYDVFAVNLRKTRLTEEGCRGKHKRKGCPCPAAQKYRNLVLFQRFVCRDCHDSRKQGTRCRAEQGPKLQPFRGALAVLLVLVPIAAVGFGSQRLIRYLRSRDGRDPQQRARTMQKLYSQSVEHGNAAYEKGQYERALSFFRSALRIKRTDSKLLYKTGVCFDKTGEEDKALATWQLATTGEEPYGPALNAMALTLYRQGNVGRAGEQAKLAMQNGLADGTSEAIYADRWLWARDTQRAARHLEIAEKKGGSEHVLNMVRAHFLMLDKKGEEALELLRTIPEGHPLELLAGIYRLDLLWQQDRHEEAIKKVQDAVDRHPGRPWAALLLTGIRFSAGQPEAARQQASKVIEDYAYETGIQLELARMLRRYGEVDWALEVALDRKDDIGFRVQARLLAAQIFLSRGLPRRAREVLSAGVVERSDDAQVLRTRGTVELALGETEAGMEYFERMLKEHPQNASAHFLLAKAHRRNENAEKALKELARACELDPESGRYQEAYGDALMETGKVKEAQEHLLRAAELLPDPSRAYTKLGLLMHHGGDPEAAAGYYSRAVQANSAEAVVAANNLANLLLANNRDLPLALSLANMAHADSQGRPLHVHTADTLAKALIRSGYAARALRVAQIAASAKPKDAKRRLRLGIAQSEAGATDHAAASFQKVVELAPKSPQADLARQLLKKVHESREKKAPGTPGQQGNN